MKNLTPGTLVSVMVGPFKHYGIVSGRAIGGMPHVISNSRRKGAVAEEPVSVFSGGKSIKVHGRLGELSPSAVVSRARSQLGKTYNLLRWNCEHFVRWAYGIKVESPQLQRTLVLGLLALSVFNVVRSRG